MKLTASELLIVAAANKKLQSLTERLERAITCKNFYEPNDACEDMSNYKCWSEIVESLTAEIEAHRANNPQ